MTVRSSSGIAARARADRLAHAGRRRAPPRVRARHRAGRRSTRPRRAARAPASRPRPAPAADEQGDERRPAPGGAQPVDRPVAGDRVQPGGQRAGLRIECLGPVPEREECLLHDLLSGPPIGCQPVDGGEDRRRVTVIEGLEGRLRSRRHPQDDGGIVGHSLPTVHPGLRRGASIGFILPCRGRSVRRHGAASRPAGAPRGTRRHPARRPRRAWCRPAARAGRPVASSIERASVGQPEPDRAALDDDDLVVAVVVGGVAVARSVRPGGRVEALAAQPALDDPLATSGRRRRR